jgi:hypothetical protein
MEARKAKRAKEAKNFLAPLPFLPFLLPITSLCNPQCISGGGIIELGKEYRL